MANQTNEQYRTDFDRALDNLERSAIASALQTTTWILHKVDGLTLEFLLEHYQDEVISILKAASQLNQGIPNMIVVENARLALIGLANERSEAQEKAMRAEEQRKFKTRTYNFVVTSTRKGKVFFELDVAGLKMDLWMDFGSKQYLDDWMHEAITEDFFDADKKRRGQLSRSELAGLADSGVKLHPELERLKDETLRLE